MTPEPPRLVESDGALGRALRDLPEPPELADAQVERIQMATLALTSTSLLALLMKKWPWKLLFVAAGAAIGAWVVRDTRDPLPEIPAVVVAATAPVAEAPRPADPPPPVVQPPAAALPIKPRPAAPTVKAVEAAAVATAPATEPPPAIEAPPVAAESEEVKLLAQAHLANRAHDVPAALRALDLYRASFPNGLLAEEAALLEVELQLAKHDELKALGVLDTILARSTRRRPEVQLVRSELLASLDRCDEALAGFKGLLNAEPSLQERAWFGVATCQLHSGNREPARTALEEYLRRFPKGARRALAIELLNDP